MTKFDDKVLIIGGDHHNTLAAIRCFAREGVPIEVLVHGKFAKTSEVKISYSKYAKKIYIVNDNEEDILKWLLKNKRNNRVIIFPCSDIAEYTIDKNYEMIKDSYIIPGFIDRPGRVVFLMDKAEQKRWAEKNGIKMAKTWNIKIKENKYSIPNNIEYPCILKPRISAFGEKSDIRIANNRDEFTRALYELSEKEYTDVLIQKFLKKEYEICAHGCIINDKHKYYGGVIKKIKEYPPKGGGSLTLAKFIHDEELLGKVDFVIGKLYEEGYRGMYDIEFLICDKKVYLNEINFRHSGNGYALIKNGIKAPFIWYNSVIGNNINGESCKIIKKDAYHMDELGEWRLYRKKYITFKELVSDIRKSSFFARLDKKDFIVGLKMLKRGNRRGKTCQKKKKIMSQKV